MATVSNSSLRTRASSNSSGGSDSDQKAVLPADHIMFRLLGDFKEHTKVKIDIFVRDDKIKIEDFFEGSDSKTFNNVLEGLTEVSKYYLNLIAGALLQWRSSQHVIPAKSISKPKLDGTDTKKDITPIVDERYKLIVDYIFCISLLTILNSLTKDNLNDTIGTQIESICYDHFKLERRMTSSSTSQSTIPDLCASILGQLSKYRLRSVSTRFFKEFQICLSSNTLKSKTFPILQGIRFLKVRISSTTKLKQSQEFINSFLDLFKNNKIKGDLRRAISEILASILRPLTEEKFKPDVVYTEWIGSIKELFDYISKKTKKTKDIVTSYPLLSILLCCSEKEVFLKSFWGLMDNFIKIKDKAIRPYALESSQYLLECYLTKYSEQPEEVAERLHQFVSHIFPVGHTKKLTVSASDSLNSFIDIICVIASSRLDFSFEKIIFDLLRGGDPKDTLGYISNPERMIIGLRAVLLIDQAGTNPLTPKLLQSFSNSPGGSPATSPIPDPVVSSNKVRAVRRQRYGTLNMKKQSTASLIEPYLMSTRPDLRPYIIGGLGKFALSLSDRQSNLIHIVLLKMAELMELWAKSKTMKFQVATDDNDDLLKFKTDGPDYAPEVAFVESVALVFLCSSNGRVRRISFSILDTIRTVHDAFINAQQQHHPDLVGELTPHIKDIIDENGNEVLYRHAQNLTSHFENKYKKQKSTQDFERLAESESKEDQLLWSSCLSDIVRAASELCPHSVNKSTELILQRIRPIQPEENPKTQSTAEADALSIWWRNYIIFACATIQVTDNQAIDIKKKTTDIPDSAPTSARELFNLIIPYLKSTDKFFVESTLMAMEKTHPRVLEVLFDLMRPFEHELNITKKTKKKTDGLRSVIGIRRHCLESLKPGELVRREVLKRSYVEFIQEVLQFLNSPEASSNDYIWDNLHDIRFNFCVLIHRIVQQLYFGAKEFLDKNLRKDLFRVFSKWSESEEVLREEAVSRRLSVFLQQEEKEVTKRKEYEMRIFEHASQLSNVASHAVSVILLGPPFVENFKDPSGVIFQWINSMFVSKMKTKIRSVTRLALQNFLKCNLSHPELIYHCVNQCYSLTTTVANGYFLTLVELCQDSVLKFGCSESILTNLVIFNSGTFTSVVRQQALQLLYFIKAASTIDHYSDGYYPSAVGSELTDTYHTSQCNLAKTLSLENPELCYEFFMDVVYRLEGGDVVNHKDQHNQMLNYVAPWIEQMNLLHLASVSAATLEVVLQGLVLITMKHYTLHQHLIERIWKILGLNQDNLSIIIDFILRVMEKTRNHDLIPVFKRICVYLGRSSPQKLVDCLVSELSSTSAAQNFTEYGETKTLGKGTKLTSSKSSIPLAGSDIYNASMSISVAFHTATDLSERATKNYPLTRFQLPLIFLSEVSFEVGEEFKSHLPLLLQLIFLGLYYNHQPVHEHCRMLLLNLIRSLVIKKCQLTGNTESSTYEDAIQLVDFLLPSVYRSDESSSTSNLKELTTKKEISNPKYVVMLTKRVVTVLSSGSNDLKELWGAHALNWATNSQNIRLALRSYQILRGLEPTTTIDSLTDVMQSLGKNLANITNDNVVLISEIQETLLIMVRCIHPSKLILFPQLFWGTLALLHTDFELHFNNAIKMLSVLLETVNFQDRAVQNTYLKQLDNFLSDLAVPLCEMVAKHPTIVFSLLFNILEYGPQEYRYPILKLLTTLVKGGVNPAETKSSRVADWYDTIALFINDHKTPSYIVAQSLRLVEISSGNSPTSLQQIDNASMKPSRLSQVGPKKFSNKVDRGTHLASVCLSKVLDSCTRSTTSLSKSMYTTTQIFEKFFSSTDDMAPPPKPYDINDDSDEVSSSTQHNPSSDLGDFDSDTIHSANDTTFDGNISDFHHFPHFQGFSDILEGLGDMSMIGDVSAASAHQVESSTEDSSPESSFLITNSSSSSFNSSISSNHPLTSPITKTHPARTTSSQILTPSSHPSIGNISNSSPAVINGGGSSTASTPSSSTSSFSSTNTAASSKKPVGNPNSPTLTRHQMQFQTNSTLSTLSFNVTAAKSWWNSCSEQIEFQSEKEIFDVFVAASQLVQQISIEYKTLFTQCVPLMSSIASEVSTFSVEIFEKSAFTVPQLEIQKSKEMSEKYKRMIDAKPSLATAFMNAREKAIELFTQHLNIYTDLRTITNNTRAKLFENGISSEELQIQIGETRFCSAMSNLYQQLLNVWNANLSLQELLNDYTTQDLGINKQREEIKKEQNKCKILTVLFKEKESDLLVQLNKQQLQQMAQQHSPTHTPIASSPVSLSSPSLLDETNRLAGQIEQRKRAGTRPEYIDNKN
ncbi:hypothetical protein PPL_00939 [Heterostelium album PN500]|uniref:Uncharacterized protein n=1 Tax=Heterostelium pallidum (strain ATCC 26659 / Pp 5 / PN500) TaxID=670386 RepID=D3AXN2_HETP5|nr:hypothetical protein PPL_00939 [Heterostelium album PN500]EFA85709.1 hypothetical protein PPL_00939 [Heterostelium album PN500]|eukprot:XP_020437815.1 hypothetical protein PPL_00939 [Heterostelium album PN500]